MSYLRFASREFPDVVVDPESDCNNPPGPPFSLSPPAAFAYGIPYTGSGQWLNTDILALVAAGQPGWACNLYADDFLTSGRQDVTVSAQQITVEVLNAAGDWNGVSPLRLSYGEFTPCWDGNDIDRYLTAAALVASGETATLDVTISGTGGDGLNFVGITYLALYDDAGNLLTDDSVTIVTPGSASSDTVAIVAPSDGVLFIWTEISSWSFGVYAQPSITVSYDALTVS